MNFFYRCFTRFNCILLMILSLLLAFSIGFVIRPLVLSFFYEEQIFFGTPSMIHESPLLSGSGVPVLDWYILKINKDKNARFVIYFPKEQNETLISWLHSWGKYKGDMLPIEIRSSRISSTTWVVHSIHSPKGSIEKNVIMDFHLRSIFWFSLAVLFFVGLSVFCFSKYMSFYRFCYWFKNELRTPGSP